MGLKAVVQSLDEVEESLHGYYKEQKTKDKDGVEKTVYVLDIEGFDNHPQVLNLKSAHERTKQDKKTLTTERDDLKTKVEAVPEDFTREEWDRLKAAEADFEANKDKTGDQKREHENLKRMYDEKLATAKREADEKLKAVEGKLQTQIERNHTLVRQNTLDKALDEASIKTDDRELVRDHLMPKVSVIDEDGEDLVVVIEDTPVNEWVAAWSQSDKGKRYVEPARGGGSGPGDRRITGNNPWGEKTWNLTEQDKLINSDPAKAQALRQQAGYASQEAAIAAGIAKRMRRPAA